MSERHKLISCHELLAKSLNFLVFVTLGLSATESCWQFSDFVPKVVDPNLTPYFLCLVFNLTSFEVRVLLRATVVLLGRSLLLLFHNLGIAELLI